jgi:hypothetical protein
VKVSTIVILAIVGVLGFGAVGAGCAALGFRSDCISAEAGIKAQYKQNQNNYDNMWKKFLEASQVNKAYADDLKELYKDAMTGRYGANGSQATFQFIKEHNPTLDPQTYVKLQALIEAGRNGFEAEQKQLLDRKMQYEQFLGSTSALVFNNFFNFPRIDLDKYDIVTSSKTEKVFEDKKDDEPVKLR